MGHGCSRMQTPTWTHPLSVSVTRVAATPKTLWELGEGMPSKLEMPSSKHAIHYSYKYGFCCCEVCVSAVWAHPGLRVLKHSQHFPSLFTLRRLESLVLGGCLWNHACQQLEKPLPPQVGLLGEHNSHCNFSIFARSGCL